MQLLPLTTTGFISVQQKHNCALTFRTVMGDNDKQYPEIKQLGYYSESIANQNFIGVCSRYFLSEFVYTFVFQTVRKGPNRAQNLKWIVKTHKHTPNGWVIYIYLISI